MAIDPATLKLIAKAAADIVTDEEKRRRLLILILAPVIGLLLLIAFTVYVITHPISFLIDCLSSNEVKAVEDFQKDHGYNQSISNKDYTDGVGSDYGDITFTDGAAEVMYFNQLDSRYANEPYGTDKIGTHGCGPTAMAIVVSSLADRVVDPAEMAAWSAANGGWCEGNGSYHSLIPTAAQAFGLNAEGKVQDTPQKIIDALKSGKLVVSLMSKGNFTDSGHFIVLRGVTNDGKILVADPASKSRSEQEWDLSIILAEARKGAEAGGPFWIIG